MAKRMTNVSRDRDSGIEVKVTMGKHECHVELSILLDNIICQNFSIRNKDFDFRIKLDNPDAMYSGLVVLNFVGKYSKVEYGLFKSKQLTVKFKGTGYSGHLVLNPKFYIPEEKRSSPAKVKEIEARIEARRRECARHCKSDANQTD